MKRPTIDRMALFTSSHSLTFYFTFMFQFAFIEPTMILAVPRPDLHGIS